MPNLKFFLLSLVPAVAVILISFYFMSAPWPFAVALLLIIHIFLSLSALAGTKSTNPESYIAPEAKQVMSAEVSQTELESILNNFGDTLIIYDENFQILFFNTAGEKLFMVKAGEVSGKQIKPESVDNQGLSLLTQVIFPTLAPVMVSRSHPGEWPQTVDLSFSSPQLELRVSTSQLEKKPGEPARFLKVIQNRTHEVALLKTKSDFVTVASHQLKTPLTHINWALETLNGDSALNDSNKDLVDNALKASHLLSDIVEDLLNISKIEEGRFGYKFELADMSVFLDQVLGQALPEANRAGIRLYFDKSSVELPKVFIDSQRLTLAITNFLDNAMRYNVKNGEVTVRATQVPNKPFIEISIRDTGIGIPQEEINKLFTKFFRADNAVKSQTEGTGLGLYISKNIIEAHGGEIRIESELNRGTIFYFTLPTDQSLVPQREMPAEM